MTTLNERAAKCMGYEDEDDPIAMWVRYNADRCLDAAALVRDRAISKCGADVFLCHLANATNGKNHPGGLSLIMAVTATPTQITEAACRCLEASE